MLLNYSKLALRLMARNPFFTLINIFGLGLGFASFFALWNYSTSELRSDQYHKDFERIARIGWHWRWADDGKNWDHQTVGFSKSDTPLRVMEDFAEVESYVRIHTQQYFGLLGGLVPHGRKVTLAAVGRLQEDRIFKEEHVVYADQNLFNFFSIPLVTGNADNVLAEAGSVVLSESQVARYFDRIDPVGELLKLNDTITLRVTGVFRDLPHNTHLNFNVVISNKAYEQIWATAFNSPTFNYVKLKEGTSFKDFEQRINGRKKDYFSALLLRLHNTDIDMFVQPLNEIIFSKNFPGDEFSFRSKSLLITFATVSIVLLAMAWINYINLWIARNKKREKELVTRKINGARSGDFIFQFLTESTLIHLFACLLALTLLQFARDPFKVLFGIQINELWQLDFNSLVVFVLVFVFSVAITGLYPALKARNNDPVTLLRKSVTGSAGIFSSSLVIVQYTSAIALILWSSVVYFELNHILRQEIGLDRDDVLVIEVPSQRNSENYLEGLVNRLESNTSIKKAAYSLCVPGEAMGPGLNTRKPGSLMQIGFEWNGVNEDYLPLFGLELLAGRNFIQDDRGDVAIISQVAAERLGFPNPADAVGTKLELLSDEARGEWLTVELIGIFMDYRTVPFFESSATASDLKNEFQSRGKLFTYKNRGFEDFPYERLSIKVKAGDLGNTIASVEDAYHATFPGTPFNWFFLKDNMNGVYSNEKIIRNQIILFVILASVIACLGFQGMITHKVTSKVKEIGIRKVLGASMSHIFNVILQPSFLHFAISIVIGMPVAWYLGQLYLQKFSERIELQWWHYAMPVVLLVLIMLSTVAAVVWKAASDNAVKALKHE